MIILSWADLPEPIRSKIIDETFDLWNENHQENLDNLAKLLKQYHATYNTSNNSIIFETQDYYNWFLLKCQ